MSVCDGCCSDGSGLTILHIIQPGLPTECNGTRLLLYRKIKCNHPEIIEQKIVPFNFPCEQKLQLSYFDLK